MYIYIIKQGYCMKRDLFSRNIKKILEIAKSVDFYSSKELRVLMNKLKSDGYIAQSLNFNTFYNRLIENGLKQEIITINENNIVRYFFNKDLDIFKRSLALQKGSFLSMSTSLNYQGLSDFSDNFIYISKEQPNKNIYFENDSLTQEKIDSAFKKEYRRTKSFGKIEDKYVVLLSPKYSGNYEVIKYNDVMVSSINRALVEMIVNIQYFKSSMKIIETFKPIKNKIILEKVYNVLDHFNFIYPYYQCVGFYLEKIGFNKDELKSFTHKISTYDFYTEKNLSSYSYDEFWKMYY